MTSAAKQVILALVTAMGIATAAELTEGCVPTPVIVSAEDALCAEAHADLPNTKAILDICKIAPAATEVIADIVNLFRAQQAAQKLGVGMPMGACAPAQDAGASRP